jgi:hypothetical protein
MNHKRINLIMVVSSLIVASLACSFLVSTAKVENLRLASDDQGAQTKTSFAPQDNFYLLGELKNAPSDTKLKAIWTGVEVTDNPANTVIGEKELTTADGTFTFSLENNNPTWPAGKYKVDLYLNDKLNQTLDFQVEGGTQAATTVDITKLRMTNSESSDQTTTVFTPQDNFYLLGELSGSTGDTRLKAVWTAVDIEGYAPNSSIDSAELTSGDGPFSFYLKRSLPAWPVGSYKVDFYVDGNLYQSIDFTVKGDAAAVTQPPADQSNAKIENIYLARDQNGSDATTVYGIKENFFLIGDLVGAPEAGAQLMVTWTAVKVEGGAAENQQIDTYDEKLQNNTFWVSLVPNTGEWPIGQYKVEVSLNGSLVDTRNFIVSKTRLDKIYMATDQEGKNQTEVFAAGDVFYLEFDLIDAPADTKINTVWSRLDDKGASAETLNEGEYTFGDGSYYISLKSDTGSWQVGKYRVEIYLNNNYYKALVFEVK